APTADVPTGGRLAARYVVLAFVAVAVLIPIYATLIGSLKPGNQLIDYPRALLPVDLTLQTFKDAWDVGHPGRELFNSLVVATTIMVGQVVTATLAAYAFAYLRFPFKRAAFVAFLATLMVPAEAIVVGNVATMQSLHWIDSYQALIVPFLATAFGTF